MKPDSERVTIGQYKVAEKLSNHPFGLTYKVIDPESQFYVGLKTFFDHEEVLRTGLDVEIVKELANPRASECQLSYYRIHPVRPNLALDEDRPLLITEWIEGITLQELLRIRRTLTLPEVSRVLSQLAEAVEKDARIAVPSLDEVMIAPLNSDGQFLALEMAVSTLRADLSQWPLMLLKFDPIGKRLPAPVDHSGGQTMVAPPWPAGMKPDATQRIAYLGYLLLGGRPLARKEQRLTRLPDLGEAGNERLHQALRGTNPRVGTPSQFVKSMCQ